jgi:hypothetical protein
VVAISANVFGHFFRFMLVNANSAAVQFRIAWLYEKEFVNSPSSSKLWMIGGVRK